MWGLARYYVARAKGQTTSIYAGAPAWTTWPTQRRAAEAGPEARPAFGDQSRIRSRQNPHPDPLVIFGSQPLQSSESVMPPIPLDSLSWVLLTGLSLVGVSVGFVSVLSDIVVSDAVVDSVGSSQIY
jgi:hypothetical protein